MTKGNVKSNRTLQHVKSSDEYTIVIKYKATILFSGVTIISVELFQLNLKRLSLVVYIIKCALYIKQFTQLFWMQLALRLLFYSSRDELCFLLICKSSVTCSTNFFGTMPMK